ncbi:MAG: hypothetical protein A2050_14280 [Candidatus Rokubacteria bacterium GWA2_73_35]|nr:MAG: hypothetical protein A2050_14280 [Candidatus Rokubacteria bacterium GWA2_73_35]
MRVLARRPVTDPAELATVVAECLGDLEPGLTLLERAPGAGEVTVDLVCVDEGRRLVLVFCDIIAGPEIVLRAVEAAAWWREHAALLPRVFPAAGLEATAPPRTIVVASRVSDRALRLIRALGPLGPAPVECRVFDGPDEAVVGLERLDAGGAAGARPREAPPAPAAAPPAPAPPRPDATAARAEALIGQLERLRFSEVFR